MTPLTYLLVTLQARMLVDENALSLTLLTGILVTENVTIHLLATWQAGILVTEDAISHRLVTLQARMLVQLCYINGQAIALVTPGRSLTVAGSGGLNECYFKAFYSPRFRLP